MSGRTALYTIFRCTNYGAVLQAYALARTLREILGEDRVDVLNHLMDPRDNHLLGKVSNPATPWFQRWRNRRKFAARYFRPDLLEERRSRTVSLIEDAIRPTERLYRAPREMADMPPYRTVVIGSDQVWNPALNHDFGCNQYLAAQFPSGQDRVAYAASFGVSELPAEHVEAYRAALSRFREITVREESGARICRGLFPDRGAPRVVLDPTMLLPPESWLRTTNHQRSTANRIAAYWVRTATQMDIDALAAVARRVGSQVSLMSAGPLPKLHFPQEVAPYVEADPFDFVRAIADASHVVTDSFHGLQFSVLFGRQFAALGDLSAAGSNASRLVDFCGRYGVSQGVQDISSFRSGGEVRFADMPSFRPDALEADRAASLAALKAMVGAEA